MPGPKSEYRQRVGRFGIVGNPNKKQAKRLAARIAATPQNNPASKMFYHKPGSQNRKK